MTSMHFYLLPFLFIMSIEAGPREVLVKELSRGNNQFALDLYGQVRPGSGNVFFSPYSISTALAMTYAGANGETARQMASTLHFPSHGETLHSAFASLRAQIDGSQGPKPYQLDIASALWGQKGLGYRAEFLKTLETSYHAGFQALDFHSDPEAARQTINAWVEKKTRDKIKDILAPEVIKPSTDLILTNAIYFKGSWAIPFPKFATNNAEFTSGDQKPSVPTMHLTERFDYLDGGEFQALSLPYKGDALSMVVLLPKSVDGLAALEASMTADKLDGWLAKLVRERVEVSLPRFKLEFGFDVVNALKSLGMKDAFSGEADFSAITRERRLAISNVIHKAFVEVNEEGTEAAAATAVAVGRAKAMIKEVPPIVFRADHPFLFLIRDVRTGSILFLGRVVKP